MKKLRTINEIIIHCTDTPENGHFTVEQIDKWHRQRGFKCIGYHYVIYLDGSVHKGREINEIGAHCLGHNQNSIGICYVGGRARNGKTKDTRTEQQKAALLTLIKQLKKQYPNATIHGHREFAKKDCPCFDAYSEYKNL